MKYLIFMITLLFLSGCCQNKDLFYVQHTKVTKEELPKGCAKLIEKINTIWLKHGKKPCHYYNPFIQSFAIQTTSNRECIIGMDASLVKKLFGKPDKEEDGAIIYILDDTCDEYMDSEPNVVFRKDVVFRYSKSDNAIKDIILVTKRIPQD